MLLAGKLFIAAVAAVGIWKGKRLKDKILTYESGITLALIAPTFYQY
jgi:hypothetical protein